MVRIVDSRPAGSASDITTAEPNAHIDHSLRADHLTFMLKHNGGRLEQDAFMPDPFDQKQENAALCFVPARERSLGTIEVEEFVELRKENRTQWMARRNCS